MAHPPTCQEKSRGTRNTVNFDVLGRRKFLPEVVASKFLNALAIDSSVFDLQRGYPTWIFKKISRISHAPNPMFACGRRRPWEGGTLAPLGGSGRGPRPIGTVGTAVRQVVPPGSLGNPAPAPPPSPFGTRRGRRRRVDATRRLPVLDRGLSLPKCPHASFFFHVGLILHF